MRLVKAGKTDQFAELVRRYRPALVRVARGRLGRGDWAEEAVQETFLSAFKSAHTYDERFSFRTWLWTILLNQCRTQLKRRGRNHVLAWTDAGAGQSLSLDDAPHDQLPSPASLLISRERTELIERLLARLPEKEADALRLRFFGELKFQEIADAVSCSLATAKNRVKSGLLKLAAMLGKSGE